MVCSWSRGEVAHRLEQREAFAVHNGSARVSQPGLLSEHVRRLRLAHSCGENAHDGCVNRLAWSDDGTFLASASDDLCVKVWRYPCSSENERPVRSIDTGHRSNIFGLAFLPCTGSEVVATGAMDNEVRVHGVSRDGSRAFRCHVQRVKAIDVLPRCPNLVFSASEDGTVRMFDLRCHSHDDGACGAESFLTRTRSNSASNPCASSICIGIGRTDHSKRSLRRYPSSEYEFPIEAKDLSINPIDTNQLAVACGDAYVRVYDRRLLHSNSAAAPQKPLRSIAPPHLAGTRHADAVNATSVKYSGNGRDVVVHYHKDHCYVMDVSDYASSATAPYESALLPVNLVNEHKGRKPQNFKSSAGMSKMANHQRLAGNRAFATSTKGSSVLHYTAAVSHLRSGCTREAAIRLLLQRATATLKRNWNGDAHAAYLDCEAAMHLDPTSTRANVRRVEALQHMGAVHQARDLAVKLQSEIVDAQGELEALRIKLDDQVFRIEERELQKQEDAAYGENPASVHTEFNHEADMDTQKQDEGGDNEGNFRANNNATIDGDFDVSGSEHVDRANDPQQISMDHLVRLGAHEESETNRRETEQVSGSGAEAQGAEDVHSLPTELELIDVGTQEEKRTDQETLPCQRLLAELRQRSCSSAAPWDDYGVSDSEQAAYEESGRVRGRYIGARNVHTDIKEASFIGENDSFIAAGSDDGRVYIWDRGTGECVHVLKADADIVNCVQASPCGTCVATSGIEHTVRFWEPGNPDRLSSNELASLVEQNQSKMSRDTAANVFHMFAPNILRRLTQDPRGVMMLRQLARSDDDEGGSTCAQS